MRDTVLASSNTCSTVIPVCLVGGLKPTKDLSFPYKKVMKSTSNVVDSKESLLCDSNESLLQISIADMCHAEGLHFNLG